jgi:hypothetical protein
VADFAVLCGKKPKSGFPDNPLLKEEWHANASDTWIIDRTRQTAELSDHPCLGAKTYHWTIEDPPFWKKAKDAVIFALKLYPNEDSGEGRDISDDTTSKA